MPATARKRLSIIPSHSSHGAGLLRNHTTAMGTTMPATTTGNSQRRVAKLPTIRPTTAAATTRIVSTVGPGVVVSDKSTTTPRMSGQMRTARSRSRRQSAVVDCSSRPVIWRIRCT